VGWNCGSRPALPSSSIACRPSVRLLDALCLAEASCAHPPIYANSSRRREGWSNHLKE
jgi:hypothetical protein